jgi:hypothetical protein
MIFLLFNSPVLCVCLSSRSGKYLTLERLFCAVGSAIQEPEISPLVSSNKRGLSGGDKAVFSGSPPVDKVGCERKDCLPMFGAGEPFSPTSLIAVPVLYAAVS